MPVDVTSTVPARQWRAGFAWLPHVLALLLPILVGSLFGLLEWAGHAVPSLGILFGLAALVAVAGAATGALLTPFSWRRGVHRLLWSVLLFVACVVAVRVHNAGRMAAFARCAENAKPLIAAIERYRDAHQKAPDALRDLVPVYLDRIPGTGLPSYREWDYGMTKGEPYELVVHCSYLMSFDSFVYWPSGRCPAQYYGGSPERIGAWVYVHE